MKKLLHKTLTAPAVSIVLRRIVENNFKKQKEIIKKYFSVTPGDRVLDLGCGTGEFSEFFPTENYTGIDIDPKNIEYAKAHYQKNFLTADGTKLPFDNASFSKVLIVGVLHHLSDQVVAAVLAEVKRVLKPDGTFLVMEDTQTQDKLVRFLQSLDQGEFIRTEIAWQDIFNQGWKVEQNFTFKNGLCFYSTFLLSPKNAN